MPRESGARLTRYLGIDLAWSDNHLTAVCSLDADGRLIDERLLETDDDIVEWVGAQVDGGGVAGVDAPLRVPNATGRRDAEAEVQAAYGGRKAGPHPSNRTLFMERFGRVRGEAIAARLGDLGFDHPWSASHRILLEVYPHPALIEAFGLSERLLYKAKRGVGPDGRRAGLRNLSRLLDELAVADPPLVADPVRIADDVRGRQLKAIEDRLDARVCAWVASVWGRFETDRVRLFGSPTGGHIAVPVGRFVASNVPLEVVDRPRPR